MVKHCAKTEWGTWCGNRGVPVVNVGDWFGKGRYCKSCKRALEATARGD